MRRLSKSKLIAYRQCPKRLWLELHRPELKDDSGSEAAFAVGHRVGEVAQQVFDTDGNGVNLDPNLIGWSASAEQTKELIQSGGRVGFEVYLSIPGALALTDVMRPDPNYSDLHWEMIEVKGSASLKDYHRDDVAIQTYIAEKSGVPLSKSCLAHINSDFLYLGGNNYAGLFTVEDLTEEARSRAEEVEGWMQEAQAIVALDEAPDVPVGEHCSKPFACGFCGHCYKDIEESGDPFAMLPHFSAKKRGTLAALEVEKLDDIPSDLLSDKQSIVRSAHLNKEVFFDAASAHSMLSTYTGPAYFLDFETISFAVPIWAPSRPYENLPFQYSLHRVDDDCSLHHTEFLDTSGEDPRRLLAEQMIEECGTAGAIFAYNAGFERKVIEELIDIYPDLASSLTTLRERVVDLLPIARECYYNPSQNGSWSLKAVAPDIAPELSYENLDGVHVGSEAGIAYLEACEPNTTLERREELRRQMLAYCELDTLATVRIWEFFKGKLP